MKLNILSYEEALKYNPKEPTYGIRIFNSRQPTPILELKEGKNWIHVEKYFFDDLWPHTWNEYSWIDLGDSYLSGVLNVTWDEFHEKHPDMTRRSLIDYLECKGLPYDRHILFDEKIAGKILSDYEKFGKGIETIMIHCMRGKNRSPGVGIAMNEIYNWGIEGLREKFPEYRRFVYEKMKSVKNV